MLVLRVAEVVYVELILPIGHHGLVVIRPAVAVADRRMFAIGAQYLDVMYTHHRTETSVMTIGIAQRLTSIVNLLGIQQTVENGFVGLEDGTVLVQFGYANLVRDIFESHEVLGKVGAKVFQFVAVIVNEPADFFGFTVFCFSWDLHSRGAFHHLTGEWLRGLAPRPVWRLGVGYLDVSLRTGIVFQHHHVVLVASLD